MARRVIYILQSRLNPDFESARCSPEPSLPPILDTMDRDDVGHYTSCQRMETHAHWNPPVDRKYSLDGTIHFDLEVNMDELKWSLLTEVYGRAEADVLKAFLMGNGIEDVELFQEALGQNIYPTTLDMLGLVQIFVPNEVLQSAQQLLEEYNNATE